MKNISRIISPKQLQQIFQEFQKFQQFQKRNYRNLFPKDSWESKSQVWLLLTNVPANRNVIYSNPLQDEIILGTSTPKVKESPVKIERETPTRELPKTLWAIPCSQNTSGHPSESPSHSGRPHPEMCPTKTHPFSSVLNTAFLYLNEACLWDH